MLVVVLNMPEHSSFQDMFFPMLFIAKYYAKRYASIMDISLEKQRQQQYNGGFLPDMIVVSPRHYTVDPMLLLLPSANYTTPEYFDKSLQSSTIAAFSLNGEYVVRCRAFVFPARCVFLCCDSGLDF